MSEVICADCREIMADMDADSVDAIVTDPPYGLSFMGKGWDRGVPGVEFWVEALRVAKPGSHLLAFGGTRVVHRLACAIEDAGWEIRDRIHWVYGSGFPKSHDVSKAIDKMTGVDVFSNDRWMPTPHPITGSHKTASGNSQQIGQAKPGLRCLYDPVTEAAKQWNGWGTALKPAVEPIILARKPLIGTVAKNVLEYGTGALNIDGCRVQIDPDDCVNRAVFHKKPGNIYGQYASKVDGNLVSMAPQSGGRWPANLIHDGSDEVTAGMGGASRYFYCPKASKKDRGDKNNHPTVKPTKLMQYLCRLVTPPGGLILDPFCGSGSTGKAAIREGFRFIGCELDPEYAAIAKARIAKEENTKETLDV